MVKDVKTKEKEVFEALKDKFNYKNLHEAPRVEKVVISTGVGSLNDKNKMKLIPEKMAMITGQKPATQLAKKSIAQFKVREGQISGYRATLRGKMAYSFLDKLIHVALPRTRDFRGLSLESVDDMNNYTFGIKENTIFPETSEEELKNVFGMSVTVVTSAKSKEECLALLKYIGLPFKEQIDTEQTHC